MKIHFIISLLFTFLPLMTIQAHGLHIDIKIEDKAVIATLGYSETQPLSDGIVTIYSPSDPGKAFQTGRSDRSGKFAFLPDNEGIWTITADDQKGHTGKVTVTIPAGFFIPDSTMLSARLLTQEHDHEDEEMPLSFKIIIGLSLIFGITGLFYGYQAKRSPNK